MDRVVEGDQPHPPASHHPSRTYHPKSVPNHQADANGHICRVSSTYDDLLRSSSFLYLVPLAVISSANPLSVI